jgi:DNA topoisomerase-1
MRHLDVGETYLRFHFRGKKGVKHRKVIPDPDLIALMRQVKRLPGPRLFQYKKEDGTVAAITNKDINAYIKAIMGPGFSAKDFRTWGGTLMAARILAAYGPAETEKERQRRMRHAVRGVSNYLGNTPAIARASYISPKVFACYEAGATLQDFAPRRRQMVRLIQAGHTPEEVELMKLLALDPAALEAPRLSVTLAPPAPRDAAAGAQAVEAESA